MMTDAPVDVVDRYPEPRAREECDACDKDAHVEAQVHIKLASGKQLTMCMHHANHHRERLQAEGAKIRPLP